VKSIKYRYQKYNTTPISLLRTLLSFVPFDPHAPSRLAEYIALSLLADDMIMLKVDQFQP